MEDHPFEFGIDLRLVPEKLGDPLKWSPPRRIFANSMSDLFHEDIPESYIANIAAVMRLADWHTYQILTKRSKRLEKLLTHRLKGAAAKHIVGG
jgi:protein gp37